MLEHDLNPPFHRITTRTLVRSGNFAMRLDQVAWPDGLIAEYTVVEGPRAAVVVAIGAAGETVLVRQWRHPWEGTSWELPAGTLEADEDALVGARRELAEEAGMEAASWTPLGVGRGSAASTSSFVFFLAQDLSPVARAPEACEQDMITRVLPFRQALDGALGGEIIHTASITALCLAGRRLGLI